MLETKQHSYETRKPSDLIPYHNNSRTHSDDQINQVASSIKEFGITAPILIDEDNGILAGHCRTEAIKKLKIKETPVIVLKGLTEAQKKAYVIADNQLTLNAEWNLDMLKLEIEALEEFDFDLDLLGFDDDFLADLMLDDAEGLTDDDAVPTEDPATKPGDIWILGKHRLLCGDSRLVDDVNTVLNGFNTDMIFTGPPSKKNVFDPFGGSGNTIIASEKIGKTCFSIEIDPRNCDVIIQRWQDFTGLEAVHEQSGSGFQSLSK